MEHTGGAVQCEILSAVNENNLVDAAGWFYFSAEPYLSVGD